MVAKTKRNSKKKPVAENITIDGKHSEMIDYFENLDDSLPKLKEELKKAVYEFNKKDNRSKSDIEYILYREKLKDKINDIKTRIQKITKKEELNKYYLDAGLLLLEYYKNMEDSKMEDMGVSESFEKNLLNYSEDIFENDDAQSETDAFDNDVLPSSPLRIPPPSKAPTSILQFFTPTVKTDADFSSTKISDFVKEESKYDKKKILDEYLQKIDPKYMSKIKIDSSMYKCLKCNIEMTMYPSEGLQICDGCGFQQNILIESDKPSFKDPPLEVCYFSYKRINHFNEWLAQFQAKETTEIPNEVYDKILAEIKKERVTDLGKIDVKKIRLYLKKNNLNNLYDHSAHILYHINGVEPPNMSKELEEKLRLMFKEIQGPFMTVCPSSRKNFLNYSYVLHKFVELLSLDEYKKYFPLLKDRIKLHQTDMIWKNICQILGWDFIKSI